MTKFIKQSIKKLMYSISFLSITILSSCEKDLYENSIKNKPINDISFNQFIAKTGLSNFETTIKLNLYKKNSTAKTVNGGYELSDFNVDTNLIKQIEKNNKTTYTFRIFPKVVVSLRSIYNLSLYKKNGVWEKSIVELIPTDQNYLDIINNVTQKVTGEIKLLYDSTNNAKGGCTYIEIVLPDCHGCSGECDQCSLCQNTVIAQICTLDNDSGDGSSGGGDDTFHIGLGDNIPGGDPNSPGGNGDEHTYTPNLDATSIDGDNSNNPNITLEMLASAAINNLGLNPQQLAWINNTTHLPIKNQIGTFLINIEQTQENIDFLKDLISQLLVNPLLSYTNLNYPGKTEGRPFEWWKDNVYISNNLKIKSDNDLNGPGTPNAREVLLFGIFPAKALLHAKNSTNAFNKAIALVASGVYTYLHNGKADAYRHAFWNARDSADFGEAITKLFTDAHEWNSFNDPLESQMDFWNNQKGREIGATFNILSTDAQISNIVVTYMSSGALLYLAPLIPNNEGQNIIQGLTQIKPTNP